MDNSIYDENGKFIYKSIIDRLNRLSTRKLIEDVCGFLNNHSELIPITEQYANFLDKKDKTNLYALLGYVVNCFKTAGLKEIFLKKYIFKNEIKNSKEFINYFQKQFEKNKEIKENIIEKIESYNLAKAIVNNTELETTFYIGEENDTGDDYSYYKFPVLNENSCQPELINFIGTIMYFGPISEKWSNDEHKIDTILFIRMFVNIINEFYFKE